MQLPNLISTYAGLSGRSYYSVSFMGQENSRQIVNQERSKDTPLMRKGVQ